MTVRPSVLARHMSSVSYFTMCSFTLSSNRSKKLGAAIAGTAANTSSVLAAARRQLLPPLLFLQNVS